MGISEILILVLLLFSIIAVIMLIITLKKLGDFTEKISGDITEIKNEVIPAIQKLDKTLENTSEITGRLEKRSAEIDEQIAGIRERISSFSSGMSLGSGSQNPISQLVSNLKAISQGISTFWSAFRK